MITLRLQQIRVPPGQRILLEAISWHEFEAIVEELGEHRGTRIAHSQGTLEIESPLPEHEKAKVVISDPPRDPPGGTGYALGIPGVHDVSTRGDGRRY
jgi:23S rRNA A2030 N6-methylase RlmJ